MQRDRVLAPEPRPAGEAADQHEQPDDHPQEDPRDRSLPMLPPRRAVTGHLRERLGGTAGVPFVVPRLTPLFSVVLMEKIAREAMGRG